MLKDEIENAISQTLAHMYDKPSTLHEAIRYVFAGGGKRLRPLLSLLSTRAFAGAIDPGWGAALATEWIHNYSLVHDDLPCLDDDSLRRGRETVHVVYGDAIAVLVGDSLLTDSFVLLSGELPHFPQNCADAKAQIEMVRRLSLAAGSSGMVQGQCLDILATGQTDATLAEVLQIHEGKTGALFSAALALGALAGGAGAKEVEQFSEAGRAIGLAFQVVDDLLDDQEGTGKTRGKDRDQGKVTVPFLIGTEAAREMALKYTTEAKQLIQAHSPELCALIDDMLERKL